MIFGVARHGRQRQLCMTGLLMTGLLVGRAAGLEAQAAAPPLPTWHAGLVLPSTARNQHVVPLVRPQGSLGARSQAGTGLLVGGLIGVAATTVFLIGFCDDPDTKCGIDEVAELWS
jgi:hypothetical protein